MNLFSFKNPFLSLSFKQRGYLSLSSAFFIHLILGSYYVWYSLITYVASALQHDGQNYTKEEVQIVGPFIGMSICFGTPLGPILSQIFGVRSLLFICSFLLGSSVIASSFLVTSFPAFLALYGVLFGFFSGIIYMIPFYTCYQYFPDRKGLVGGVITSGYSIGSAFFIWLLFLIINPSDKKPTTLIQGNYYFDKEICNELPKGIRILGCIQLIGLIICILFHESSSQQFKQQSDNSFIPIAKMTTYTEEEKKQEKQQEAITLKTNQINSQSDSASQSSTNNEFDSIKEGLKTKHIYLVMVQCFTLAIFGCVVLNYKIFGEEQKFNDSFLNAIGAVGCITNSLGRIIWGFLFEKINFQKLAMANLLIQVLLNILFQLFQTVPFLFFIIVILEIFSFGGLFSMIPALVTRMYGRKIGPTLYSIAFFGFCLSSFTCYFLLSKVQIQIGRQKMFWVLTLIQIIGLFIISFVDYSIEYKKKPQNLVTQKVKNNSKVIK